MSQVKFYTGSDISKATGADGSIYITEDASYPRMYVGANKTPVGQQVDRLAIGNSITSVPNYSIVGGTNDKTVITGLVGSTAAGYITATAPSSDADCTISVGSSTKVFSTGGNAIGVMNTSGVKGYYYTNINFTSRQITLSTKRGSSSTWSGVTLDWAIGDTISFVNGSKYPACCKITAISSNTITVDTLPFASADAIETYSALKSSTYAPDDFTIFACYEKVEANVSMLNITNTRWYPRSGSVELGWAATAFGVENLATGSASFTAGYGNWSAGDFSTTFGRENIAGYGSLVAGQNNSAPSNYALVGGSDNTITKNVSSVFVAGKGNIVSSACVGVVGLENNISGNTSASIVGGYKNTLSGDAYRVIVAGNNNTVKGNSSLVVGAYNVLNHTTATTSGYTYSTSSVIYGEKNTLTGLHNLLGGRNNNLTGSYNIVSGAVNTVSGNGYCNIINGESLSLTGKVTDSIVAGKNNVISGAIENSLILGQTQSASNPIKNSIVVGQYHSANKLTDGIMLGTGASITSYSSPESIVFVVGNGSSTAQANSIYMTKSGNISAIGNIMANKFTENGTDLEKKYWHIPYCARQSTSAGTWDTVATAPAGTTRLNYNGHLHTTKLTVGGFEIPARHDYRPLYLNNGLISSESELPMDIKAGKGMTITYVATPKDDGSSGYKALGFTYKVNLVNEAASTNAATYQAGGSSKFYAVQLDKNNKLGVYVPWTDTNTTYSAGSNVTISSNKISVHNLKDDYVEIASAKFNAALDNDKNQTYTDISNIGSVYASNLCSLYQKLCMDETHTYSKSHTEPFNWMSTEIFGFPGVYMGRNAIITLISRNTENQAITYSSSALLELTPENKMYCEPLQYKYYNAENNLQVGYLTFECSSYQSDTDPVGTQLSLKPYRGTSGTSKEACNTISGLSAVIMTEEQKKSLSVRITVLD